ncbi:MAG TPA: nucleoside phosphorylase [bacterium]|nr:nucleoside phosphorylase [bacterium]
MAEEQNKNVSRAVKREDEVVVEPRALRIDPRIYDPVILCPVGPLTTMMARMHKASKKFMPFEPARVYTISSKGRKASLVGPCMGAPAAGYVLERLIANGARHVVMLGLCGSINREARIGSLVAPMGARIEEGVSGHYITGDRRSFPGKQALAAVREAVEGSGRSYHLGPVWTTDAVFRETKAKVAGFGEKGLLAVEMEASALFTIAMYRGIELAALLVVSDELFDLTWRTGFTRPRFITALRHACHIALDAAFRMAAGAREAVAAVEEPAEDGPGPSREEGEAAP